MNIAICDDEMLFRDELKQLLIKYKKLRRIHLDIFEYDNGISFLESNYVFDIVFMDYQMEDLNGMDTAKMLRKRNSLCNIIFITNFPEFMIESFEVNPYRFFKKPINESQITSALDTFIKNQKKLSPILVNIDGELKTIKSKDIIYLEGDGKYCNIRTNITSYHSSKTISKVLSELPQHCFYRVHKSYVVNLYFIDSIKECLITFTNGEKALISRKYLADFKKSYKNFVEFYYVRL